jgi:ribosomal protein L7/L12
MPGGFWIFLLIVVANLVITIIKKTAERRAKLAGGGDEPTSDSSTGSPARRVTGEGDHEMILERAGDHRIGVVEILRKDLQWDLPTAMALAGTTPSVIATGLTRSEAGYLRNRFEAIGAGVSVRRATSESASTVRDLDLDRRQSVESLPRMASAASQQRAGAQDVSVPASGRVEALRRRDSPTTARRDSSKAAPAASARSPRREMATRQAPPRQGTELPRPVTLIEVAADSEPRELRQPRAARAARQASPSDGGGTRPPSPNLGRRIRVMAGSRRTLQEAFVLQELLRPPLSLRPSGRGGRDS